MGEGKQTADGVLTGAQEREVTLLYLTCIRETLMSVLGARDATGAGMSAEFQRGMASALMATAIAIQAGAHVALVVEARAAEEAAGVAVAAAEAIRARTARGDA